MTRSIRATPCESQIDTIQRGYKEIRPQIGLLVDGPLSNDAERLLLALRIVVSRTRAVCVAKLELCNVAVKVLLGTVVIQHRDGATKMIQILSSIRSILWQEWDPIGVHNLGGPDDEYDGYAFHLYLMFRTPTRPSISEIAAYLNLVQTERMGLELIPGHNEAIAARIAGL